MIIAMGEGTRAGERSFGIWILKPSKLLSREAFAW
jgi:hypothetical protein